MKNKLQRVVVLERNPINETERIVYKGDMNVPEYPRVVREKDGIDTSCNLYFMGEWHTRTQGRNCRCD